MRSEEIYPFIDHTLLRATATLGEVTSLCGEAERFGMASVCLPPSFVSRARDMFRGLRICTVIGFPLGYSTAETKIAEIQNALADGADEVDAVINLGDVKSGEFGRVATELRRLRDAAGDKILKIIVETCALTEGEKITLCKLVTDSGADFIKTSTGFGTGGAVLADIELFKKHIGANVKIKASGGIRTREAIEAFISAGCARIGTSSAVAALNPAVADLEGK